MAMAAASTHPIATATSVSLFMAPAFATTF
jgi:hypothetical protein